VLEVIKLRYNQIKLRLEVLILKYEQMINGYKSAIVRTESNTKRASYTALIVRLKGTIGRINEALDYIMLYQKGDIDFGQLCSQFRFKGYKQER